jgi:hypothetical protein
MLPEHIASHMAYDVSLFSTAESYETVNKKSKYICIRNHLLANRERVNILNKHGRTLLWNLLMEHQIAITHFASSI